MMVLNGKSLKKPSSQNIAQNHTVLVNRNTEFETNWLGAKGRASANPPNHTPPKCNDPRSRFQGAQARAQAA